MRVLGGRTGHSHVTRASAFFSTLRVTNLPAPLASKLSVTLVLYERPTHYARECVFSTMRVTNLPLSLASKLRVARVLTSRLCIYRG